MCLLTPTTPLSQSDVSACSTKPLLAIAIKARALAGHQVASANILSPARAKASPIYSSRQPTIVDLAATREGPSAGFPR